MHLLHSKKGGASGGSSGPADPLLAPYAFGRVAGSGDLMYGPAFPFGTPSDWCWHGWIYFDGTSGRQNFAGHTNGSARGWQFEIFDGNARIFHGVASYNLRATSTFTVSAETWTFLGYYFDSTTANSLVLVKGDYDPSGNGTLTTENSFTVPAETPGSAGTTYRIAGVLGSLDYAGAMCAAGYHSTSDSSLDHAAIFAEAYNSGAGKNYANMSAANIADIRCWHECQEASGNALDAAGNEDLSYLDAGTNDMEYRADGPTA